MRRFLWGGSDEVRKLAWVAWEKVTRNKEEGGLGLANLEVDNKALLLKWFWRYLTEPESLWRKIIVAIHGADRKWGCLPSNNRFTGVWKNIVLSCNRIKSNGKEVCNMVRGKIGNGADIRFWIDPWLTHELLKDVYPLLFGLEQSKCCRVKDRLQVADDRRSIIWDWNRALNSEAEWAARDELEQLLLQCTVMTNHDRWDWNDVRDVNFSVAGAKKWLKVPCEQVQICEFKWCRWLPSKVNIFMWRAMLNRLPTRIALQDRHIAIDDPKCVFCGDYDETVDHILTGCGFVAGIWSGISGWCRIPNIYAFSAADLVKIHTHQGWTDMKKKLLHGIMIITAWRVWKARNEKMFSNKNTKVVDIISDVIALGYLWFKSRAKWGTVDWDNWCNFDVT